MATTRNQIKIGSTGSSVKELQEVLNKNGYSLDVDGVFGSKTQAAVKDYQKKNNLQVDGIVGKNTWGSLYPTTTTTTTKTTTPATSTDTKSSGSSTTKKTTSTKTTTTTTPKTSSGGFAPSQYSAEKALASVPEFSYKAYDASQSPIVTAAMEALQAASNNKPAEYQSSYEQQINDVLNKILNREEFSYDLNGDALYKQYKDQYTTQGKQAMMDTMGQAAALTGGYGNTYAQTVGQQTYQGYLQQLNDKIPELYQLALDKYTREGDELYNQYGLYTDRENAEYNRYRDLVGDYYTNLDYLTNMYLNERDFDYGKYIDNRNLDYQTNRDKVADTMWATEFGYGQERNSIADQQWQTEFDEAMRQYKEQMAYQQGRDTVSDEQWQREFEEAQRQFNVAKGLTSSGSGSSSSSSGGGSSSGGSKKSSSSTTKTSTAKANQKATDATAKTGGIASFDPVKAKSFTNNDDLWDYLLGLVNKGSLSYDEAKKKYSQYAITKNLNTSGSKYAYGTGATGGYNNKTATDYYWK